MTESEIPGVGEYINNIQKTIDGLEKESIYNLFRRDTVRAAQETVCKRVVDRRITRGILEDQNFFNEILSTLDEKDRHFLTEFWSKLNVVCRLYPDVLSVLKAMAIPSHGRVLRDNFRYDANKVIDATSFVYADSNDETLRVGSALTLFDADKSAGPTDALIVGGTLNNYLNAIEAMLKSLVLNKDERSVLGLPGSDDVSERIRQELNDIEAIVSKLKDIYSVPGDQGEKE